MSDQNGSNRIRAPLSNADRRVLARARHESASEEVMNVVVDRVAYAIGALRSDARPALALTEVFPDSWKGYARPARVVFVDAPGVVARIG